MSTPPDATGGRPRVGYLGPAGTFSEEALLASVAENAVEPVAEPTIYDSVLALRRGEIRWAVVPIENSLEGSINVTLDVLAEEVGDVRIVGEVLLGVHHCLIAVSATVALQELETVLTHPQVPGQCTRFLRGELAHARIVPASSTAEAVRTVMEEGSPTQAALGTVLAAGIYGASVLREGVEDNEHNETRFVWLARAGEQLDAPLHGEQDGGWKTSVVFQGLRAERPGGLVRCLDEFARRDINLTKIESRPRRERIGSYMFFVDLAGRIEERRLADAVAGVGALCEEVRVLGSYRAARSATSGAA